MSRESLPGEQVPILRALAACIAREVPVRILDESPWRPRDGSDRLRLVVEVNRDAFYRSLKGLLDTGAVSTARLFARAHGPGVVEEIQRDGAVDFALTLMLVAQAGYSVVIHHPAPGRPSGVAPEDWVMAFTVNVPAEAFYSMRPHQF